MLQNEIKLQNMLQIEIKLQNISIENTFNYVEH